MRILTILSRFIRGNKLFSLFFGLLGILSAGTAISSLFWTNDGDNISLLYLAFLTDKFHLLPYRDFFYFQMPSVHLFYYLVLKIFGYSYIGFRIADLFYLLVTLSVSYFLFKNISKKVAVSGIILFSLIYFIGRTYFSLQRDYILLLPLLVSILYSGSYPLKRINSKSFFIGFCCAVSASIKPHSVIVFPVLFVFHILMNTGENTTRNFLKISLKQMLFSVSGFILPVVFTIFYLWFTDSIKPFWEIQTNFTLLYRSSKMFVVSDSMVSSGNNIINNIIKLHTYRLFLIPAALGFYVSVLRSDMTRLQKLLIYEIFFLMIFFLLYVIIAAKFFWYHWIPFAYFLIFLSSTCFVRQKKYENKYAFLFEFIPPAVLFLIIAFHIGRSPNREIFYEELTGASREYSAPYPLYPDINKMAEYLRSNLNPGDKVLPLDNTGIAMHSMYLAKAQLAFYYTMETVLFMGEEENPGSEYFHRIHWDYMNKFNDVKPRFVIDFTGENLFPDLRQILLTDYNAIHLEHGVLFERKR